MSRGQKDEVSQSSAHSRLAEYLTVHALHQATRVHTRQTQGLQTVFTESRDRCDQVWLSCNDAPFTDSLLLAGGLEIVAQPLVCGRAPQT